MTNLPRVIAPRRFSSVRRTYGILTRMITLEEIARALETATENDARSGSWPNVSIFGMNGREDGARAMEGRLGNSVRRVMVGSVPIHRSQNRSAIAKSSRNAFTIATTRRLPPAMPSMPSWMPGSSARPAYGHLRALPITNATTS